MKVIINSSLRLTKTTNAGFTLIELMVTIAVMAIIVSIAAPNVSTQLANQRVKSTAATLENALKEAKAESIIRRQELAFTYNNNSTSAGTINVASIASYNYNAKSTIKTAPTSTSITFEPSKIVSTAVVYTICDSNTAASPRQVSISKLANVSSKLGGTCP